MNKSAGFKWVDVALTAVMLALALLGCGDASAEFECRDGSVVWTYKSADSTWSVQGLDGSGRPQPCECVDVTDMWVATTAALMLTW